MRTSCWSPSWTTSTMRTARSVSAKTLKGLGHEIEFNFLNEMNSSRIGLTKNLYWFFLTFKEVLC
jgi:hypothetical protein